MSLQKYVYKNAEYTIPNQYYKSQIPLNTDTNVPKEKKLLKFRFGNKTFILSKVKNNV